MYDLLHHFAEKDLLLGRSLSSLYDQLRDFQVYIYSEGASQKQLVGLCALHICWEDLAEIRSLAINESFQGKGCGAKLVQASLNEARRLGISRVFTLTYQPSFFEKFGFEVADKQELPHKVWSDCINCPKFPDCNEEAMILKLDGSVQS